MTRAAGPRATATTPDVAALAAIERLVAHSVAGSIVRIPDLTTKLFLADVAEASMGRAVRLRDVALAMAHRDTTALVVSTAWAEALAALDDVSDTDRLVALLVGTVAPFVRDRHGQVADTCDPLYDARLVPILREGERAWAHTADTTVDTNTELTEALGAAWIDEHRVVALPTIGWAPQDRVPEPARLAGAEPFELGAPLELYESSRADPANLAHALRESVLGETCALELMARSSYEHPDLPWPFHLAALRHAADEARHARIFLRLLEDRGGRLDDGVVHATLYSSVYEFPTCPPGSKQELAWRLLVLCTCLEGLAIDQFAHEQRMWDHLGQDDLTQAVTCVLADELFHAESGLRWAEHICTENGMASSLELELAHAWFVEGQRQARDAYIEAHPDRARQEQAIMDRPDDEVPFHSRVEVELRARAGYTEDLIAQVRGWAYHADDVPFANEVPTGSVRSGPARLRP